MKQASRRILDNAELALVTGGATLPPGFGMPVSGPVHIPPGLEPINNPPISSLPLNF